MISNMARCAYCLKSESETSFNNREHVIPQSLGLLDPDIFFIKGDFVCDKCNNFFSDLETLFIEDTWEGTISKDVIRDRPRGLERRGKLFSLITDFPSQQDVFDKYHHYLEMNEGALISRFVPQISLIDKVTGKKIVHPFSEIAKASNSKKKRLQTRYKNRNFDVGIYALHDHQIDEAIKILQELNVAYNEKERATIKERPTSINVEIQGTITPTIVRVVAKIAFNYLIYSADQEGSVAEIFGEEFNNLRRFIMGDESLVKTILVEIDPKPMLLTREFKPIRYFAHVLSFEEENGLLMAKVNFYGVPLIYKILLGKMPDVWKKEKFGSGHLFNPVAKEIFQLIRVPDFPKISLPLSFGLFQKII